MNTIRLAISTCPNDTFAFHALLEGLVDTEGLAFSFQLLDIQQLNQLALNEQADVVKASFAAAVELADRYWVLPSGSALGFGVGPLLLSGEQGQLPQSTAQCTLCPGKHTTAALLFELFYPHTTRVEHVVFSEIMPQLLEGAADFGVCIHEGRFTWQQQGLHLVEDLGSRWEQETGCPLPLGGILASRRLPSETTAKVQRALYRSLQFARQHPEAALVSMRRYAQEFDDQVLIQHVDLYVNEWTLDLGSVGAQALTEFSRSANKAQVTEDSQSKIQQPLEIFPVSA